MEQEISLPKREFEEMKAQIEKLKLISLNQSAEFGLLSEESFAETWLNKKEDQAWKDL